MSVEYDSVILCGFPITDIQYDNLEHIDATQYEYENEDYLHFTNSWTDNCEYFFGKIIYRTDNKAISLPYTGITYAMSNDIRKTYTKLTGENAPPCGMYLYTLVH